MGCGASTATGNTVDDKAVVPAEHKDQKHEHKDGAAEHGEHAEAAPAVTAEEAAAAANANDGLPEVVADLRAHIIEALKEVKPDASPADLKSPAEQVIQVIAGLENFNATNIESAVDEVLLRLLSIKDGQLKQVSAAIEASIKDLEIDMKKVHEEVAKIDFSKRA